MGAGDDAGAAEASSPRTRESAARLGRSAHRARGPSRTMPASSRSNRRFSGDAWCAGQTPRTCEQAPGPAAPLAETCSRGSCAAAAARYSDPMAQSTAHKHDSTRRATYQDVLDAPAHRVAEIVDGTLYTHPRPAMPRALASSALQSDLSNTFQFGRGGPGGWWIIFEPELHLGEDILVPDLAGWRRERMPDYPDTAYVSLPPDWVCEVLSASTRRLDLQEKRPVYAREAVGHLWLVDPADRTLEAFELHEGQWLLIASAKDDEPVSIRPFDAITFSLGDLWP